jgi:hypothetical protein
MIYSQKYSDDISAVVYLESFRGFEYRDRVTTGYWAFKNLMGNWSVKGVNVFMQKVSEDEFVIQEETHFHS